VRACVDAHILALVLLLLLATSCAGPGDRGRVTTIMPLGDSITDGYQIPGGYRIRLWRELREGGFDVDFVGSLRNGPSALPDKDHEGHSGWRIDQIQRLVDSRIETYRPDVVLLLIGTNDILRHYHTSTAPARLGSLLDRIRALRPTTKILVSTIPPSGDQGANGGIAAYDAAVRKIVRARARAHWPVWLVDGGGQLTHADLADGVHPNVVGYEKLARAWYQVLARVLPRRREA
jgi:lysophospholipase L1-like esterase